MPLEWGCTANGNLATGVPSVRQGSTSWVSPGVLSTFNNLAVWPALTYVFTGGNLIITNPSTRYTMQGTWHLLGMQLFGSSQFAAGAELRWRWEFSANNGGTWTPITGPGTGAIYSTGTASMTGGGNGLWTAAAGANAQFRFRLGLGRTGTQLGLTIGSNGRAWAVASGDATR